MRLLVQGIAFAAGVYAFAHGCSIERTVHVENASRERSYQASILDSTSDCTISLENGEDVSFQNRECRSIELMLKKGKTPRITYSHELVTLYGLPMINRNNGLLFKKSE